MVSWQGGPENDERRSTYTKRRNEQLKSAYQKAGGARRKSKGTRALERRKSGKVQPTFTPGKQK